MGVEEEIACLNRLLGPVPDQAREANCGTRQDSVILKKPQEYYVGGHEARAAASAPSTATDSPMIVDICLSSLMDNMAAETTAQSDIVEDNMNIRAAADYDSEYCEILSKSPVVVKKRKKSSKKLSRKRPNLDGLC